MKVIIAGSRTLHPTFEDIDRELSAAGWIASGIISGCAAGPDTVAIVYAEYRKLPCMHMPADWSRHGRAAGPIRNGEMAKIGDALLAFWDGKSRGTHDMIERMEGMGKPVRVVRTGSP